MNIKFEHFVTIAYNKHIKEKRSLQMSRDLEDSISPYSSTQVLRIVWSMSFEKIELINKM